MLLEVLRKQVLAANLEIVQRGLVIYTFGNASGYDAKEKLVAIKPSGVPFEELRPEHMIVTRLDGSIVEGTLKPSSDVDTHLEIYRNFPGVGGVVHTHSTYATAWAQARKEIPCFGTTHADYFHGPIPVTAPLTPEQIAGEYELETGKAIIRRFQGIDPLSRPGVLVAGHGPFAWGPNVTKAAMTAAILEEIARVASITLSLSPSSPPLEKHLHDRHFLRKHGPGATYGQG